MQSSFIDAVSLPPIFPLGSNWIVTKQRSTICSGMKIASLLEVELYLLEQATVPMNGDQPKLKYHSIYPYWTMLKYGPVCNIKPQNSDLSNYDNQTTAMMKKQECGRDMRFFRIIILPFHRGVQDSMHWIISMLPS